MRLKEETGGIDRTLFITGYLGLVLNTFALFSIKMNDILMASISTSGLNHSLINFLMNSISNFLKCSSIILVLLALCIFLISRYKEIVHKTERLEKFKKAVIISALISVLFVIIFFVPFMNPVRDWLKSILPFIS